MDCVFISSLNTWNGAWELYEKLIMTNVEYIYSHDNYSMELQIYSIIHIIIVGLNS